jgi:hypothetical protein
MNLTIWIACPRTENFPVQAGPILPPAGRCFARSKQPLALGDVFAGQKLGSVQGWGQAAFVCRGSHLICGARTGSGQQLCAHSNSREDSIKTARSTHRPSLVFADMPKTAWLLGICGAPGGSRTPDLLVRSQTLYPAELRARVLQMALPQLTATEFSPSTATSPIRDDERRKLGQLTLLIASKTPRLAW